MTTLTIFDPSDLALRPPDPAWCPDDDLLPEGAKRKQGYVENLNQRAEYGAPVAAPTLRHPANVISAECEDGKFRLIMDLDVQHVYVPSSTPGHAHLYFPTLVFDTRKEYLYALGKLADLGLLERGYVRAAEYRGTNYLRATHDKPQPPPNTILQMLVDGTEVVDEPF